MGVRVREIPKGSGVYYVCVQLDKRRQAQKIGTSKKDAQYVQRKIQHDIACGRFTFRTPAEEPPQDLTLSQYFRRFESGHLKTVKPATSRSYSDAFKRHVEPTLGSIHLNDLNRNRVKMFVDQLKTKTWKPKTGPARPLARDSVRIVVATLRKILAEAYDDQLIAGNPCSKLAVRYRELQQIHSLDPFSEEEIVKFMEIASEQCLYWFPYYACLFHAGLRPGEGVALRWSDVDFERHILNIRLTGSRGRIGSTKTGRSRQVEMTDFLHSVLQDLLLQRKREWNDLPEFVFCTSAGTMADLCNIRDQKRQNKNAESQRNWTLTFSELLKRANLKPRGLHQFRHSFATIHLQNATPIEWVSRQLGHSDVGTTYRHYFHYIAERQKAKYTHVLPTIGVGSNNNLLVMKAK